MSKVIVNPFYLTSIPKAGVFVCHGKRACGKSTLAREITRTLCQRDQPQRVMLVGDEAIRHAGELSIPPQTSINLIPSGWAVKEMQALLNRGESQAMQERRVILLDINNMVNNRTLWDQLFAKAAGLNIALVVTTQNQQQLCGNKWKNHVDLFFGFAEACMYAVQIMWETFFCQWTPSRSDFQKIFDQCTQAHECVVFDVRAPRTPYYCKAVNPVTATLAGPVTEPQDLKLGSRVIYRVTRDAQDAERFLSTLLTTLMTTRVIMYTPYSETHQLVVKNPGVMSVHRVMSYKRLVEVTRVELAEDVKSGNNTPTMVFCETQELSKLSKLLDLACAHVSVVIFTDRDPPLIEGVSYFFKNKLWSVYNDELPRNVHGFPIVDVTAESQAESQAGTADSLPNTQQLFQALQTANVAPALVHPKKFDVTAHGLPPTGVFACVGPAHCGKSTLAAQLVEVLYQTHNTQYIVLAGDDALRMKLPDTKTTLRLNVRIANSALLRLMEHQSAVKSPDNIIVVLDQLIWWEAKTMTLFKDLLSRLPQLNMALVVVTQHMHDLSLLKDHINFLFAFPTPNKCHVSKLWDGFFTECPYADTFKSIMDARNPDTRNTCAVHVKDNPTELYQCAT